MTLARPTPAQTLVAAGMLLAILAAGVALWLVPPLLPPPDIGSAADRLAFSARWMLVPALCLATGVGFVSAWRFGRRDTLGEADRSPALALALRYNLNTLEQVVLAAVAWTGLALTLDPSRLAIIPTLAGLFAAGRMAFAIGYAVTPPARAFGMGLTAYPTYAALVWLTATWLG